MDIDIKTGNKIWHVKNILKTAGTLLVTAIGITFLPIHLANSFLFGLCVGIIVMRFCVRQWVFYHIEPSDSDKLDTF